MAEKPEDENKPTKLSNILDAVKIQRDLLTVTGTWPVRNPTFTYRLRYYCSWSLDLCFQFFLFTELYKNYTEGEYKEMTELLSFMSSEVPYLFKHFFFDYYRRRFLDMMDRLNHPMFNDYPKVCDQYVQSTIKFARIFMRAYQFTVVNLVLLYFLKPFVTNQMAIRFSLYDFGQYWLLFHLYQVTSIGNACYNNSTFDILSLGIISIGTAQFEILRDKLANASKWAGLTHEEINNGVENPEMEFDPRMDDKINAYLGECVKHHLGILELVSDIEHIYTYFFLVQFSDSVLAICNTWFQFLLEDEIIKLVFLCFYIVTLLLQLGMYCIYGNNLMLRSEELRDACYFSKWYNSGIKVRKSLMLIMERCKRPSVLTAGKFSILNLATYVGLLKMSYSYFTLMNRLYGD